MTTPSPSQTQALYSCTDDQQAQVLELVGDQSTAAYVCSSFDCSITAVACVLQYLAEKQQNLADRVDGTASAEVALSLDVAFLLFSAYLVFGPMQLGFALLQAGSIRCKNCMNVLLKNILDACTAAVGFYLFGYAFAYGHQLNMSSNGFIGDWNFALSYTTRIGADDSQATFDGFAVQGWHSWLFQWSLCAVTIAIVSGAVAERCAMGAYLSYAFFMAAFVYPVVVHWVWSPDGWLSAFNTSKGGYALILRTGAIDFSGGGVVHLVGGTAALCGAWVLGPRIGRFDASGKVNEMKGHSSTLVVMGAFLLWFGFYGFNPGGSLTIATRAAAVVVSRVAVTTTLSAGAGGLVALSWRYFTNSTWDLVLACNGALAGLVSITSSCAVVEPWAAIICGGLGALVFVGAEHLVLYKMKIDDPVSAVALHMACGVWALLFTGLLAKPQYVRDVYGSHGFGPNVLNSKKYGILYGGHGQLLLCQAIAVAVIAAWTAAMMGALFYVLKTARRLRVPVDQELAGLDVSKHAPGGMVRTGLAGLAGGESNGGYTDAGEEGGPYGGRSSH